ncbi:MAG: response regulator transcription factor [Bryobacteraceae bacterium]
MMQVTLGLYLDWGQSMHELAVYSDDSVLSGGAAHLLQNTPDFPPPRLYTDARQLLQNVATTKPDLLLLDLCPDISLSFISDLRKAHPACKIVLWAREVPPEFAYQAMALGIRGILNRTLPSSDLLRCLRKVGSNDVWFDKEQTSGFFCNKIIKLTRREGQLVALLARGLKNKEIAPLLSLSEGTVKVYFYRFFEKLNMKDRFELALYGLRNLSSFGPVPIPAVNSIRRPRPKLVRAEQGKGQHLAPVR